MNCHVCKVDKILMREHPLEKHLPIYHTSIFYEGQRTKEIDIIFCGAKCSLEYYQYALKGKLNDE